MPQTYDMSWDSIVVGNLTQDNFVVRTDHDTGLGHSAAWRGINYISDMLMKVPCRVIRTNPAGGGDIDRSHQAHKIVMYEANPYMTAETWKHLATFQAIWYGNHVSYIQRDRLGRPLYLWPIDPNGMALQFNPETGDVRYAFSLFNKIYTASKDDVVHIFGISNDGYWGLDFLTYVRKTLQLGLITKDFATKFFKNGANASGALKFPPGMTETQVKDFFKRFQKAHESLDGSHKVIALWAGMDYEKLTIANDSSQFLETQDLNDRHVANFLKLPPSVVGVESSVAYASYEQHRQEVLDSAIDPWMVRFESEFRRKLLTERQKDEESHYFSFLRRALKRVNHKDLVESLAKEVDSGIKSLDEARGEQDMPATGMPQGAQFRKPKNVGYIDDEEKAEQRAELDRKAKQESQDASQQAQQQQQDQIESAGREISVLRAKVKLMDLKLANKANRKRRVESNLILPNA